MKFLFPEFWYAIAIVVITGVLWHILFRPIGTCTAGRKSLPGPWGLPIVGYIPFLGRKMNKTISVLAKRYGDIFRISIGTRNIVVINGQQAIRKALLTKGTDFAGRPDFYSYRLTPNYALQNYSPAYRAHKKLTQKAFHTFSHERKMELQQVTYKAACALLNDIQKADGKPINPKQTLMKSTCLIMGYICYGNIYNPDSEEVATILSQSKAFGTSVQFGIICDFIPKAAFLMKGKLQAYKKLIQNIIDYSDELASIHIDTYNGEKMRDLSDMFHKAGEEMNEDEKKVLNVDNRMLKDTVATLFGGGFATVAETLYYGILLMALHSDVQVKVQEEIDQVIGRENYPNMDDSNNMPYSMAVINEIYRYHSMSAFGFTHATTCDTELDGYFIPEGTPVMFNFWSAHRDPTVFTDPDKFNPNRFLTPDGKLDTKATDNVIPYGLGHRRCGGEIVARMEVIMFFLTLLQRCVIKEVPEHPLDPENYTFTLGVSLNPFKVKFEPRFVGAFDVDV